MNLPIALDLKLANHKDTKDTKVLTTKGQK